MKKNGLVKNVWGKAFFKFLGFMAIFWVSMTLIFIIRGGKSYDDKTTLTEILIITLIFLAKTTWFTLYTIVAAIRAKSADRELAKLIHWAKHNGYNEEETLAHHSNIEDGNKSLQTGSESNP